MLQPKGWIAQYSVTKMLPGIKIANCNCLTDA